MQLKWTDEASLRRLAENSVAGDTHLRESTAKRERLLYDLLVHKAELEMQNEALREAQVELRLAHERYRAFFDKASVAHVVLDTGCLIIAANGGRRRHSVRALPPRSAEDARAAGGGVQDGNRG
jgi:hypothetical protein